MHRGFRPVSDGLIKRIEGKHNVTKGGQIVLICNTKSLMPRAYLH